jgi:lipopolysaccharide heptosyltransferase I
LKILILKPSSLGDVVQALPVLRLLKQHWRDSEIHWWIETRNASLLEDDPDLAGIFRFDRRRWSTPRDWAALWNTVRAMRQARFDLIIDLQALARSGTIGWLANGSVFVGLQDGRELAHGYYDLNVPRPSPQTHAVDWYLEVPRALGVPVHSGFEWMPKREDIAHDVEALWPFHGRPTVALLPGARWENKRWPVRHFHSLVAQLRERQPGLRFVILGGKPDMKLAEHISSAAPDDTLDLTGRTSLPQMVEILRQCRAVVTNDTGPMHVAAALRKPVIGVFGPTNPARTGPYGQMERALQRRDLPCVPCMKASCVYREPLACLAGISPQQVVEEVLARIG